MKSLFLVVTLGCACACGEPGPIADPCGLGMERPGVPRGSARYKRDGVPVATNGGGYKLAFPHDIVVGAMTLNIKQDRDRRLVQDLVETHSFPICVPMDSSEDGSGYALVEDVGASYSTSDQQSGMLVILTLDDDALIGRFAFHAHENAGERLTRIEDGVFHLLPR